MSRAWDQAFSQAEFAYNSTIHSSIGMSHFSIVYLKVSHHLLDLAKLPIGEKFSSAVSVMVEQTINVQMEVQTRLEKSNTSCKAVADKKRREKVFEEGDMMMVYLRKERTHTGTYNRFKPKK